MSFRMKKTSQIEMELGICSSVTVHFDADQFSYLEFESWLSEKQAISFGSLDRINAMVEFIKQHVPDLPVFKEGQN